MESTKKCPICGSTILDHADKCTECGMEGLNRIFLNEEEYKEWAADSIEPRREGTSAGQPQKEPEKEPEKNTSRFDAIHLEPYIRYNSEMGNPIPTIEKEKFRLTVRAKECIEEGAFEEAATMMERNAVICHSQGKEDDAYSLEHGAFLCRQQAICREAGYRPDDFRNVPEGVPNVKLLQDTLTRLADQALYQKNEEVFILCKLMNAWLCRAMGEERNAYLLETSAYSHQSVKNPQLWEELRRKALKEPDFLKMVAEEYTKDFNRIEGR